MNSTGCFGRYVKRKIYLVVYILLFFVAVFSCLYVLSYDDCHCPENASTQKKELQKIPQEAHQSQIEHKLAVLVPFRDRFNELLDFVPYMTHFLKQQSVNHQIFVLNQIDSFRFNRASLINVGFKYAKIECDYLAMHDVDLLPLNNQLKYSYPKTGVYHISSPDLHPRYHYPTFVGGILIIKREDFEKVNGMSNKYWGWGLEDDEFYIRLKEAKIQVYRPVNISTGKDNTFRHSHDKNVHKRDMQKCFNQSIVTRRRDRVTGLHDVDYKIQSIQQITVNDAAATVVNIELKCDRKSTPWCKCDASK